MTNQFGMVSPWSKKGNIVSFTGKNPEVNRLHLVCCGHRGNLGYSRVFIDS